MIKLLRHQLHRKGVATSFSGRDNICKRRRSRHHLAVATSIARTRGLDVMKQLRQQEQETKVATPGGRDNSCKDQRVVTRSIGRDIRIQEIKRRRQ